MQIEYLNQTVTPDLRQWILAQVAAGCMGEDILKAMRASGWNDAVARAALAHTLQGASAEGGHTVLQPPAEPVGVPVDSCARS